MKQLIMVIILAGFGIFLLGLIIGTGDDSLRSTSAELMQRQVEYISTH